jgi:hypothetical protein
MIYLFTGDDFKNKTISYEKFVKSIPVSVETLFINRNNFNQIQIESLYYGSGLFFEKSAVIFSGVLEYEETRDFIMDKLKFMEESANSFIFLEGRLNKSVLDSFKKARAELNIFELPKEKKEKFNNFLVANAFEKKDKLNMWIYFRQAIDREVGMEELVGVLFWKIKDMLIKKDFRNFSETQLKDFISHLSYLLPEARKDGRDAESAFEQFLLEVF